ncbi:EpsG family protein [Oceanotoga sp. DSM 15011]|uniref:EpsG family protein n=1 Tax=Oceanotoga sp. DSM 15011 TaxID=2984951 RepID=UPI0021F3EC94|nr:EpsG family protein [Oceanotoga sp. DSM 15011]UYO99161.1 EpsG family protein [Oceanotoga sp. DSM 15011]
MILSILYSLQHLLSVLSKNKKLKMCYIILSFLIFIFIYTLKPDTYDIISYVKTVDYPYFEPLFTFLILLLRPFFDNRVVIFIIQFLIFILTLFTINLYLKKYENNNDKILSYIYVLFSVGFTLGINNGLRSYTASLIIFISIYLYLQDKKIKSFLVFLISIFFHYSSFIFFFVIIIVSFFSKKYYFQKHTFFYNKKMYLSLKILIIIFILFVMIGIFLLPFFIKYTPYAGYFNRNIIQGRVDFTIKYIPMLFIYLFSEFYFGKIDRNDYIFSQLRIIRAFFIILMGGFVFFNSLNELSSRVLGFYYTLEMIILALANVKNYKNSSIIINLGYSMAINAINVIGRI